MNMKSIIKLFPSALFWTELYGNSPERALNFCGTDGRNVPYYCTRIVPRFLICFGWYKLKGLWLWSGGNRSHRPCRKSEISVCKEAADIRRWCEVLLPYQKYSMKAVGRRRFFFAGKEAHSRGWSFVHAEGRREACQTGSGAAGRWLPVMLPK